MDHKKLIVEFNKQIKKLLKEEFTDEYLQKLQKRIIDNINNDIKDGEQSTIARNLTLGLGVHAGDFPKHLILNKDQNGWKYITRYLLWQQHILTKLFNYKEVPSRSIGCILALSALWKMEDLAQLSRRYFQVLFEEDREKYKKKETHHLFIALLFDLYKTSQINSELYDALPKDSVYKNFIDNWQTNDQSLISNLLFEICDFHIYSALDLKTKFTEILSMDFIPYEIRLIELIRSENGFLTSPIEHPLMKTELAQIPIEKANWDLSQDQTFQFLLTKENQT
jgi:hypothetical protein